MATSSVSSNILKGKSDYRLLLASRIIGSVDLFTAIFILAVLCWSIVVMWNTYLNCSHCLVLSVVVGIYILATIFVSALLILSTLPVMKIYSRKWIAVCSCILSTFGLLAGTIFSCVAPGVFHKNLEGFFVMTGYLLKVAALVCLVCKYVWVFAELMSDQKSENDKIVPIKFEDKKKVNAVKR